MALQFAASLALCLLLAGAVHAQEDARPPTMAPPPGCGDTLANASSLPVAKGLGDWCGAGIGICPDSLCCSQYGKCEESCASTCQCAYSGAASDCPGSTMFSNTGVPVAPPAGVCGPGVATCEGSQCCSVLGFCTDNCDSTPCSAAESGASSDCDAPPPSESGMITLDLEMTTGAPDGFERSYIGVNGASPGPTIRCTVGETLSILVRNKLDMETTIHWHGMLQRGTIIMDGVPGVTQVALPPASEQLYVFACSLPGTFWYHSHFKAQYIDGLKGALIVDDPARPALPMDSIVQLTDWYHVDAETLMDEYLSPASGGDEPTPLSALINGVGQGGCEGDKCKYAVVPATEGTCDDPKTQLRLINEAGFAQFTFSVDGHKMIVIGLDGVSVTPSKPLRAVVLNAGQRVGVALCPDGTLAAGQPAWIRAAMVQSVFPEDSPNPVVLGVLQYGEPTEEPRELPTTKPLTKVPPSEIMGAGRGGTFDEYELTPISKATPPAATVTKQLDIDFFNEPRDCDNCTQWAHFNNLTMQVPAEKGPKVPSIVEALLSGERLPRNRNFGYHTILLQEGDVVDLIINNFDTGEHPLHLHGHQFWVMNRGGENSGPYDDSIALDDTPLVRDTATVEAGSYLVMRFVASNPGVWIFHCHIDWHLGAGLAVVFAYD